MTIKRIVAGGVLAGAIALGGVAIGAGTASAQPWDHGHDHGRFDQHRDWNRGHDRDWRDRGHGPVFIAPPAPAPFFGS